MTDTAILPFVSRPGRYLGCEYHSITPQTDDDLLHWALVFPDLYEIGMSHQGLHILYHLLNSHPQVQAERSYCPAPDAEELLRAQHRPLTALESGRPLGSFDLLGITLPHELCYTNILTILDLAGLPFRAADRVEAQPLVIGGGACAFNAEPVAELFDAILLGDGEEAIFAISDLVRHHKRAGTARRDLVEALADIPGVYLPHHYQPRYDAAGRLIAIEVQPGKAERVRRRVLPDLDRLDHLMHPLVPNAKIVHDRLGVEIARGCTRGCRFCQAGITYRPVRERSVEQICALAEAGIARSGFDEIALLSLSTGDYSCLPQLLPRLMNRFAEQRVSLSMPSMRVGTLGADLMEQIKRVRKTGFTLAPEAGSERLRRAINKGITEEDLLASVENAFALGWNLIKLYFMIGLPGETLEDVDAIAELARKTGRAGKVSQRGRRRVTVSVGTFVPKPHTPFQWEPQLSIEQSRERIGRLRAALDRSGVQVKYHTPEQSYLEGVFSRGDRRLTELLIAAWRDGARLDSWSDYFHLERWLAAANRCGIDLDAYLRRRSLDEVLPWHHLDTGVDPEFLKRERQAAEEQHYTPDCRYHGCQKCGLCDFKTIRPLVQEPHRHTAPPGPATAAPRTEPDPSRGQLSFITYERIGPICFLGHLEFMQAMVRSIRRAGLSPLFSQGFNPTPKLSFGPALPVGTESLCEFLLLEHRDPLTESDSWIERLNQSLPPGVRVTAIRPHRGRLPQSIACSYRIDLPFPLEERDPSLVEAFLAAERFDIDRSRKNKTSRLDLRPLVRELTVIDRQTLTAVIAYHSGQPGCKPLEVLAQVLQRDPQSLLRSRVRKTAWQPLEP